MEQTMDLSYLQLATAYAFILVLLVLVRRRGIKREKDILIACVRMTVQLLIMGYVLLYVFQNPSWPLTSLMIAVMLGFAMYTVFQRSRYPLSRKMRVWVAASICVGSLVTILFFLLVVIRIRPWYNPQYFIPLSGMIVGNTMTGVALGMNRLCGDLRDQKDRVENSLMLGATYRAATHELVNQAFDASILPTLLSMMSMGIISLPGMMTGQILAGTLPTTAIKYQIGIMLAILGSVAMSVYLFVSYGVKTFFNEKSQLVIPEEKKKQKASAA